MRFTFGTRQVANEGDEFAKRCDCRNWLRWTNDGVRQRRKGDTRSWAEAEQVKRDIEDQLTGKVVPSESPGTKTIHSSINVFLADKRVEGITADVVGNYTREFERLRAHCDPLGVYTVQGLTRELLTGYCSIWAQLYPSTQTQSAVRARTRSFLRYCSETQWIPRIPSLPKITVDEPPTMPLDASEYAALLEAA